MCVFVDLLDFLEDFEPNERDDVDCRVHLGIEASRSMVHSLKSSYTLCCNGTVRSSFACSWCDESNVEYILRFRLVWSLIQ